MYEPHIIILAVSLGAYALWRLLFVRRAVARRLARLAASTPATEALGAIHAPPVRLAACRPCLEESRFCPHRTPEQLQGADFRRVDEEGHDPEYFSVWAHASGEVVVLCSKLQERPLRVITKG